MRLDYDNDSAQFEKLYLMSFSKTEHSAKMVISMLQDKKSHKYLTRYLSNLPRKRMLWILAMLNQREIFIYVLRERRKTYWLINMFTAVKSR